MKSSLRYLVAARQSEMAELEQIRNACSLVTRASGLIHQLQKERGLSNLLLASAGVQGAAALTAQILEVDAAIADVRSELEANKELSLPGRHAARLFNAIAYLLQGLDALPALRQNVQTLAAPTPQECTAAFVRLISGCMALVFEAADSACDPEISRLLVAMFQAATQINEQTLSFLPRLLVMLVTLIVAGPWLVQTFMEYILQLYGSIPQLIG